MRQRLFGIALLLVALIAAVSTDTTSFRPVTTAMLLHPDANDWLMFSRTYDAQRFSPLKQITRQNVSKLKTAWTRTIPEGYHKTIPIVYRGVMYVAMPGTAVQALDAATGNLLWEYTHDTKIAAKTKSLAIFGDLVYYLAGDGNLVALDARTGHLRWKTKTDGTQTSAPIVVEGKVITGRSCMWEGVGKGFASCYIAAHNAETGEEAWRFYTAARPGDPGGDTWGDLAAEAREVGTWGLPGSYDPARRLIYWGVSNPTPNSRLERHGWNTDAIPRSAPADLYSNSTIALDPATGKIVWYYQHLPGDDWDLDYTHERTLFRTPVNPDPKFVKWINPTIRRNEPRDVAVMVGEGGGIFALDRRSGQFLWATPFPGDVPEFAISRIDVTTGKTFLNTDRMFKSPGEGPYIVCYWNTRGPYPTAYHPRLNTLFVPFQETCIEMAAGAPAKDGMPATPERRRTAVPRPGSDPAAFAGLAKINMATGEMQRVYKGPVPGYGAVLATAGDLVFWGQLDGRFRAFDAESGQPLWESKLGGPIQNSTITYAVNGKQYVAVMTGNAAGLTGTFPQLKDVDLSWSGRVKNEISVFALTP
jgi:alcohol dehydrogenase (cytochrome c)